MRVLTTGSRTWDHEASIGLCLDILLGEVRAIGDDLIVVHGACDKGADRIVDQWCIQSIHSGRPVRVMRYPALWSNHGKRAGFLRNDQMVSDGADLCMAFIRDASPGATHCAETAERAGITVRVVDYYSAIGAS